MARRRRLILPPPQKPSRRQQTCRLSKPRVREIRRNPQAKLTHNLGVRTLIPALIGRPTDKPPSGYWRRQMKARLHLTRYTQRWQVETVHSMLKRLLGSALRARKYWTQCREIFLRILTLNMMILRRTKVFYRAPRWLFSTGC